MPGGMICPVCYCFFCDDSADKVILGQPPSIYCSRECRKTARHRRSKDHAKRKVHYPTLQRALSVLRIVDWAKTAKNPGAYWCCERGYLLTANLTEGPVDIRRRTTRPVAWTARKSVPHSNTVLNADVASKLMAELGNSSAEQASELQP